MTVNCESCQQRLVDHHYRELALDDARSVAEHLADCASCALEYCRLSAALAGFRVLDRDAPSAETHRALRAKVEETFRPPIAQRLFRLLAVRVPIYQPALVILLLFVVWTLVRSLAPFGGEASSTVVERFDGTRVEFFDDHVL